MSTNQKDPKFERLIRLCLYNVRREGSGLDPNKFTESFLRDWLRHRRAEKTVFEFSPDYDHFKNLAILNYSEMSGALFGVTADGFSHMAGIVERGGELNPTTGNEAVYFKKQGNEGWAHGWKPVYEWMPEIKDWYIPAYYARIKLDEIISRGYLNIPGVERVISDQTYFFIMKDFAPWLNQFGILEWLKKEKCREPGGLEGFLRHWEPTPAEKPEPKQPEAEDRKPVGLAPAVNTFRRDGDIWEFSFNETTYRFPHLKGFEYLFEIIKRQGEKINALDLDAIVSPQSAIPKVNENLYQDEEGNSESGLSFRKGLRSELPILSEKEIKDLKKDLEGEKDRQKNAIIEGNIEVENEATEAIRLIEEQLNAAPTSTRRSKHEDPAMENSRKGIKKNINTAIKKIKDGKAEDLAAHLKESISTGRDISYNFGKPTVPWETS